jgi:hypothetical protein
MAGNEYKFQKLTPVNNTDLKIYKDALDFVFANEDIKNVGVSGAYSAGKSSVIETYKALFPEKRFLHISLTYFESAETKDDQDDELQNGRLINENILEGKILNQLIHQIDTKKIPQTSFRVKHEVSNKDIFLVAIAVILFACALAYFLGFDVWKQYVGNLSDEWLKRILQWSTDSAWQLFSGVVVMAFLAWFIYTIFLLQQNKSFFKKVSVQGNEIEIFEQSDDSYFDKYLNEVLYLFENSGADVIVFEDMDRYNANQIFQRLREVNSLVNNRRKKTQKQPLRFFYLLRDDIFVSKDRTKFFDFIIPIVPILDGSNSYDQFIAHFEAGGLLESFDEKFLQDISLYVDDMRILKNIYNEFVIYNNQIRTTEQNYNKLLAVIVYKNLFPRDFSDLQLNKGFIYTLFAEKDNFIENEKKQMEKNILDLKTKIKSIENEVSKSEEELNMIFNPGYRHISPQMRTEHDARKNLLKQRTNGDIELFKLEIEKLKQKIQTIQSRKLCEIITKENIDNFFKSEYTNEIGQTNHFHEIKGSGYFDLLKYLIRYGFIDETYPDYLTYFYENSLSRVDKVFLRSVTDEKAKDFSYTLKNPELVVSRLRTENFKHEETLNFDLVAYLLRTQRKYPEKLNNIMLQLKTNNNLAFVKQFFITGNETRRFISYINHSWPKLFTNIIHDSDFNDSQKKEFALASIYYSPNQDLVEVDTENELSGFIIGRPDFLQINEPKIERIIEVLELLDIKFAFIEYKISDPALWSAVYSHDFYELNQQMIESILENQYHLPHSEDYHRKNYSLIMSLPEEPLAIYVKNNIEDYMTVMLEYCTGSIFDDEEAVIDILNNEEISNENKELYLDHLRSTITSLRSINDITWWKPLIQKNLLSYSVDNVLYYFFETNKEIDDTLISFINDCGESFDFDYDVIDTDFGEKCGSTFINAVVRCNYLKDNKYMAILQSLNRVYNAFSINEIEENKIDILIKLGMIKMNLDNLRFMRENYQDNILKYISQNIQVYIKDVIDEDNFLLPEALEVLDSSVNDTYKIQLLKCTNVPISTIDKKYSMAVEAYILENNFDNQDLPDLLRYYDSLYDTSKKLVLDQVKLFIDSIIADKYVLAYTLLIKLLSDTSISDSNRLKIFADRLSNLDITQCIECLTILQRQDFLSLFDLKRPIFRINDTNESILKTFIKKGWINSFTTVDSNYYKANGRKHKQVKKLSIKPLE